MQLKLLTFLGACCLLASSAHGQSIPELRAQAAQTRALLNDAESQGMDQSMLNSLRESLAMIEQSIDEMERDQANASDSADVVEETPQAAAVPAATYEDNLISPQACRGFDESNYRSQALIQDNDVQLRTMCGQAWEYYTMYKRAVDQRHPEAYRTYAAHRDSALVVNSFYGDNRALPNEGIRPDTRTAADDAAIARAAAADAASNSPPEPPRAPACRGCVTPQ